MLLALYKLTYMVKRKASWNEKKHNESLDRHRVLMTLGKDSYASGSAINSLLHDVEELGDALPSEHSRKTLYRARQTVCNEATPYGPLVVTADVPGISKSTHTIAIQNPIAMLWKAVQISTWFSTLIADTLRDKPCSPSSPWSIVIYQDGVNPSDGLSKNMSRKVGAFYWSFLEFGPLALSREEVWFSICGLALPVEH